MEFPKKYKVLENNLFSKGALTLIPIRLEDKMKIMQWRNEQIYHLRQEKPLTEDDQNNYFDNVVSKLFEQEQPNQILFSYLENDKCVGYGGLVHIDWQNRNAEISLVMNTELEGLFFDKYWSVYLALIEELAFVELNLHKIFTYAFNLRPQIYPILEKNNYNLEAILKEHIFFNNRFIDVYQHMKLNSHQNLVNK
jgi:RimJ/RimL family protein N-acetyltransferase